MPIGDMANAILMLKQAVDKNPDPRTVTTLASFTSRKTVFKCRRCLEDGAAFDQRNVQVRATMPPLCWLPIAGTKPEGFPGSRGGRSQESQLELQLADFTT